MAFVENFAPFFDLSGFAVAATLDGRSVRVIFDAGYSTGFDAAMGGTAPHAMLTTADADGAAQGSTLVVGSSSYTVAAVEPDGTGVTTLRLYNQAAA